MLKKIVLSGLIVGSLFSSLQASSFGSKKEDWKKHKEEKQSLPQENGSHYSGLFSDKNQAIKPGQSVNFEEATSVQGLAFSSKTKKNELVVKSAGTYLIAFTATRSAQDSNEWGLGVAINDKIAKGSISASNFAHISGQIIVQLKEADRIALSNVSEQIVSLTSEILGSSSKNASATLVVTKL